jgi:hypothetical protein
MLNADLIARCENVVHGEAWWLPVAGHPGDCFSGGILDGHPTESRRLEQVRRRPVIFAEIGDSLKRSWAGHPYGCR